MNIGEMSNSELVAAFEAMSKWSHYDPHGTPAPSEYSVDELREEITVRLDSAEPLDVQEEYEQD